MPGRCHIFVEMSVREPMSPLPGAYYSCCLPVCLFSGLSRIVWEILFPPQCEACNVVLTVYSPGLIVVTSKWQDLSSLLLGWLPLIFPFSCRSLLCHIHLSGATILWNIAPLFLIVPCNINYPQSDTIKYGHSFLHGWFEAVWSSFGPQEGFWLGSFPDFLSQLTLLSFVLFSWELSSLLLISYQQNTTVLGMPSDFIYPHLLKMNSSSLALLLSFYDLILLWTKKKDIQNYKVWAWGRTTQHHISCSNIWFTRGARKVIVPHILVCIFRNWIPKQWVILHKRNQGHFSTSQSWRLQLLPYSLGLEGRN